MKEVSESTNSDEGRMASVAGKYLTFSLGCEQYGIEILKVIEINSMMHITHVPRSAPYVQGVVNLRGKIIPVVDLRMLFGLERAEYDEKTCTIIVNAVINGSSVAVGMIVDRVVEVVNLAASRIAPAPEYGASLNSNFILGMGKLENNAVVILIDIVKVLGGETLILE